MLLSDSKYLHIFLIRIHLKGLRWHFKSLMKCYCQKFNFQCSCKAEEPSWKLNDLFFTCFKHQQSPYHSPQSFEMHLNYSQRQRDGIPWLLQRLVASSHCYWKTSIRNTVRNEYVLWYNVQDFSWVRRAYIRQQRKLNTAFLYPCRYCSH